MWQDLVLTAGGLIGVYSNGMALWYTQTKYPRRSSIPKAITLGATAVAYSTLGLAMAATVTTINVTIWTGIIVWRAPDVDQDENRPWMKQIRSWLSQ